MDHITKFVSLDVSKETIAVAVAERGTAPPRYLGSVANTPEAVRKLVRRLGKPEQLLACYEAGPTGYGLYRLLSRLGVRCIVVAPSLTPVRPGDQVKADRRDALRMAQLLRAGELSPVWVPGEEEEALRDLVRARESAKRDLRRARQELTSFLLRHGVAAPKGTTRWSRMFMGWLDMLSFPHRATQVAFQEYPHAVHERQAPVERLEAETDAMATESRHAPVIQALQALKGVRDVTAVTLGRPRSLTHPPRGETTVALQVLQFSGHDFSLTDCVSFAIMERLGIHTAFSFDVHFTVVRLGSRSSRAITRVP